MLDRGMLWVMLVPGWTAAAKSLQSCSTLCDPIDGSPPGSPIPGILQARTLEWVATDGQGYLNKTAIGRWGGETRGGLLGR